MAYNKVILVGRLVTAPEMRKTGSGIPVASFRLAVDRQSRDETDFFNVVAWRESGEFAERYFSKGQEILVEGKMQNRNWTDKDGNKRQTTEVIVDRFSFVGSKRNEQTADTPADTPADTQGFAPIDDEDDQLPF